MRDCTWLGAGIEVPRAARSTRRARPAANRQLKLYLSGPVRRGGHTERPVTSQRPQTAVTEYLSVMALPDVPDVFDENRQDGVSAPEQMPNMRGRWLGTW
jgi:hypothetical protein